LIENNLINSISHPQKLNSSIRELQIGQGHTVSYQIFHDEG